jgi:hypothetical protein
MSMISIEFWCPLGAPLPGFIYATGQEFTRIPVEYGLEPSFFYSKSIFESLFWSISIMGRTRYTNLRVPKGHSLITGPWAVFWVGLKGIVRTFCLFFLIFPSFLFLSSFIWNDFKTNLIQTGVKDTQKLEIQTFLETSFENKHLGTIFWKPHLKRNTLTQKC